MGGDLEQRQLQIEKAKIQNEKAKIKNDFEIKKEELRLRQTEIENAQARASTEGKGLTAPAATALAAVMTLLGGIVGAGINGYFTNRTSIGVESEKGNAAIELEKFKFQTGLVIKAIETKDQSQAVKTLKFFANAGLISNFKDDVIALAERDEGREVPTIGSGSFDLEPLDKDSRRLSPYVAKFQFKGSFICTGFALPQKMVVTANYCLDAGVPVSDELNDWTVSFGSDTAESLTFKLVKKIEVNNDLGILIAQYSANETYPIYSPNNFRFRNPRQGEILNIVSYSNNEGLIGRRKCIVTDPSDGIGAREHVGNLVSTNLFTYRCIGPGRGSGGAAIFSTDDSIVGIVWGGINQTEWGVKGGEIYQRSKILKTLSDTQPP
jgi:hypothetical protein